MKKTINTLVVDDKENTVNYHTTDINNSYFYKISLEDLYQVFSENNESIFKYDTSECLSLILDSGAEISLHQYQSGMKPVFMKLTTPVALENHFDIMFSLIKKNYVCHHTMNFSNVDSIKYFVSDVTAYDGFKICQDILNYKLDGKQIHRFPAIDYCNGLNIKNTGKAYQGYLPSTYQLFVIAKHINIINYALTQMSINPLPLATRLWWTASEGIDNRKVHTICHGQEDIHYKTSNAHVFPLFREI